MPRKWDIYGVTAIFQMAPVLDENARAARRLHGLITPSYPLGQRNGKIRNYKSVRDLLQRYVDKVGLDDIKLHDFRAKAITDAKKQGYDPQALAGHGCTDGTLSA